MEEGYRWDANSYDRIALTGIPWQVAAQVLRSHPQVRWHIGSVLRIAAPVTDWLNFTVWIMVALIEEDDDQYLVVGARQLDPEEVETCRKMLDGGTP